jgi:uncharacterized protein (TIGR02996 family)
MNQHAFLDAILAEPDDDTHRLVYADWLDDHGQSARAALIRAQVLLAALAEDDPARAALEDEADDLLAEHEAEWSAPLRDLALAWEWRRGFPEQATLRARAFLEHGGRLCAAAPLRDLRLIAEPSDLPGLAQSQHLGGVEALDLSRDAAGALPHWRGHLLRDQAVQVLLASPYLKRIKRLSLAGHGIEGPAVQRLVQSGLFDQLTELDLSGNQPLGDRAARALAEARAGRLEVLRVRNTNLTRAGAQALFAVGWPRLRILDLDLRVLLLRPVRQPDRELPALLEAPAWDRLTSLCLKRCELGRASAEWLASNPRLAGLTELDLSSNAIGPEGAQPLAASPHLAGLRVLRLRGNGLRDAGARDLASSPYLRRLTELDLDGNQIGGPGIHALARSATLAGLRALNLSNNFVGLTNVPELAGSPHLTGLTRLALVNTGLNAEALAALAGAANLARLRSLDLRGDDLDGGGARALLAATWARRLRELKFRAAGLPLDIFEAGLRAGRLPRLSWVVLNERGVSPREWDQFRARFGE